MPEITSNNAKLYYEVNGDGFPIIFTHGASWNNMQWKKQIEFFKDSYKVITWDVRGHGHSSLPDGPVHSDDFSADLIALMDHLNLEQAILCGLSMGGHISLQTAIKYPNRVKSLILIGTPCSNTLSLYEKIVVPINRFSSRFISMALSAKLQAKILSKFNPDNYDYIVDAFSKINKSDWLRIWGSVTRMESKNDLHKVLCPTLLLIGDHDSLTNKHQPFMLQRIKNAKLITIPNAHHGTNLDNPVAVNESIIKFITKTEV